MTRSVIAIVALLLCATPLALAEEIDPGADPTVNQYTPGRLRLLPDASLAIREGSWLYFDGEKEPGSKPTGGKWGVGMAYYGEEVLDFLVDQNPALQLWKRWVGLNGLDGTFSVGELTLIRLPQLEPQGGRPLCRIGDRVYESTGERC